MIEGRSAQGRWVLTAAALGTGMAFLDSTVVNIALRVIGTGLGATLTELQWVVNAYLLTLSSLILVSGSLGDRFGRRRVFLGGVAGFAIASVLCALAQSPGQLIVARLVQGVFGALLTPGSLALLQASFRPEDRARAIGQWSGLTSLAIVAGPLVGGWVLEVASWRWIFWINVPLAAAVLAVGLRHVPESRDEEARAGKASRFDVPGALASALALVGVTYALTEAGEGSLVTLLAAGALGVSAAVAFVVREHRTEAPLMPLELFGDRVFRLTNVMTLLVYGSLGATTFFVTLQLQVSTGMTPLEAGLATLPITGLLIVLSGRSGALATRIGPRTQLTVGPLLCGVGTLMLVPVGEGTAYLTGVLPGLLVFGLGLTALVAPLTASVLAAAPDRHAGVASGINNAIARSGGLLAVAALPAVVGLTGDDYLSAAAFTPGYEAAQLICGVLLVAGGAVSFVGLRGTRQLVS
jgi:EmrB/QacA subfamily drug resistance transporter